MLSVGNVRAATLNVSMMPTSSSGLRVGDTYESNGFVKLYDGATDDDLVLSGPSPTITLTDTDTGSDALISGSSTTGSLTLAADTGNEVASSTILFQIDGSTVGTWAASGTLDVAGISVAGTAIAEYIADTAGAMFSGNTETSGVTVTYQDSDNTIDVEIAVATLLADLLTARGQIIRRGSSAPEALAASTADTFVGGDGTDVTTRTAAQVLTSLGAFSVLSVQVFTASDTYTPTTGMKYCIVEAVGGGGGGGGCAARTAGISGAGGGGGGAYARSVLTAATIGASKAVAIGAGGTGGTAGNNAGNAGGDTTLGTTLVVADGGGAGGGAAADGSGSGGTGGTTASSTGTVTVAGGPGMRGIGGSTAPMTPRLGQGGAGAVYGSPTNTTGSVSSAGTNAGTPGSGGSGGQDTTGTNRAGGDGADGYMIITEFG